MLGAIIGDIVGSRFEFHPTNDYNFEFFSPECSYTDDTICTIAVADALLHGYGYGESIHHWCRKYPDPMGGYGCSFRNWVMSDHPKPYGSFGNGAAMRISALGWLPDAIGAAELVIEATGCTHNHPEGIKGAMTVARAIHDCLQMHGHVEHIDRETILEAGLKGALEYSGYDIDIDVDKVRNRFDETCQGTVPVALWIISESNSFEDAIRRAVSLGADADTLGAIVGGIAEAIWGIPEWMKKKALTYLPEDMRKVLNDFRKQSTWHLTKTVKEEQKKAEAEQLDQFKAIMRWKLGLGNMGATLAGGNVMPQKTHRAEWHEGLLPMPDHDVTTMDVSIPLTTEQRNILLLGHIPECQEDHWYMYDDCGCISYHRSWTGMCAFQAFFRPVDGGYEIDKLTMNHELAEFGVNGDMAGVALFRYLIAAEVGDNAEFWWQNYLDAWQELYEKYSKK